MKPIPIRLLIVDSEYPFTSWHHPIQEWLREQRRIEDENRGFVGFAMGIAVQQEWDGEEAERAARLYKEAKKKEARKGWGGRWAK